MSWTKETRSRTKSGRFPEVNQFVHQKSNTKSIGHRSRATIHFDNEQQVIYLSLRSDIIDTLANVLYYTFQLRMNPVL